MAPDPSEIRRVLQVYDNTAAAPAKQALGMLEGITKAIAKAPEDYDLLNDPSDAQSWTSAGGESYCENQEFTNLLARRWMEVLSRPDLAHAGLDKDDCEILRDNLKGWIKKLEDRGLEFGNVEQLMERLQELIAAAPDADDDSDDSNDSD